MLIMGIDASSICTGIFVGNVSSAGVVTKVGSASVVPLKFDITKELGFKKTKVKFNGYKSYVYSKDEKVSKSEAKKRNVKVRQAINDRKIKDICQQLTVLIGKIQPDVIVIERNRTFNSVLTSALLAEVMGTVESVAHSNNIELFKYNVEEVRKIINAAKLVSDFSKTKTPEELSSYVDVTKEAIKEYFEGVYNIKFNNCDESDACAIFNFHVNTLYKK